jgi:ribonuclease E
LVSADGLPDDAPAAAGLSDDRAGAVRDLDEDEPVRVTGRARPARRRKAQVGEAGAARPGARAAPSVTPAVLGAARATKASRALGAGALQEGTARLVSKERRSRPLGRYLMIVHVGPTATQIAVLEGRTLIEHYVSRPTDDATQIDGNIYLGRVQNVLPGMEAAFVDIGTPKNAVLYRGDLHYDTEDVRPAADDEAKPTRGRLGGAARDARIESCSGPGRT